MSSEGLGRPEKCTNLVLFCPLIRLMIHSYIEVNINAFFGSQQTNIEKGCCIHIFMLDEEATLVKKKIKKMLLRAL